MRRIGVAVAVLLAAVARAEAPFMEDCGLEVPGRYEISVVPAKPFELAAQPGEPPLLRRVAPGSAPSQGIALPTARLRTGSLFGRSVYVSPGHGFTNVGSWRTQRPNTNAIVEDLVSIETVNQLLIPMLLNAGALVVPVREPDITTQMVVVDDLDAAYSESGPSGVFTDSTLKGYGHPTLPLSSTANPFQLGKNRLMDVSATPTVSATWAPTIPASGTYNVYLSYSSYTARVTDAHFVVKHQGGESHFRINQRRHGGTWLLLGRFYFRAGLHPDTASVVALNDSKDAGNVSLDAVRFGGGMGLSDTGIGVSGRPRFEECARYHTQFAGAPATVHSYLADDRNSDIVARSRFTAWEHEAGEDAVYVAWHTNAFNGSAYGTDTYVYGPNPPDGTYQFTGTAGSDKLAQFVHGELINDIRNGWGPATWRDRGIHSAYFGELNPAHNPETPAILLEVAFHDNASDAAQLKEPRFRYLAARAITQGIIKYFADRDGTPLALPPEPPAAVAALNQGNGAVLLKWSAPLAGTGGVQGDAPAGYRVYRSSDGVSWDDGLDASGASHSETVAVGVVRYYRVTSVNGGGESFPSEVVGIRASAAPPPLLAVNAFDRLEAALGKTENLSAYALGSPLRIFIDRMNDGSYLRAHGNAIAYAQVGFDGATASAVAAGEVPLSGYAAIDWFAGRGHAQGKPPTVAEQQLLRAHVEAGKALLFSGSHAASGLAAGGAADVAFLSQVLHVSSASGTGGLWVEAAPGQFLEGLSALPLDDGLSGAYDTGAPDVPVASDGVPVARYSGGTSTAAVAHAGSGKVVFLSFPFETVNGANRRAELMGRILAFLGVIAAPPPLPDGGTEADGGVPDAGPPPPPVLLEPLPESYPAPKGCGCGSLAGFPLAAALLVWLARRRRR
ncbi:MAG: N-acetylmuramoyl-L-alanine amidase [Myxococcales bacterium]|nr:N-acetylmuramoyl-L-alanine amidase [Myxococcales bacterium]